MSALVRPQPDEYEPFFQGYVHEVHESDILTALTRQAALFGALPALVAADQELLAYAPGKWTVRELVGHLGDGERTFGYRAFAFSRQEPSPLPGFDEDRYVANSRSRELPLAVLVDELVHLRQANLRLFEGLSEGQWSLSGIANGKPITVRALAFVMAGHVRHHLAVLRERYGVPLPAGVG